MPQIPTTPAPFSIVARYAGVVAGVSLVGAIDHFTGTEIRVLSLYFVPLALAGWQLKRTGAVFASLFATFVWPLAQYTSGVRYSSAAIWSINILTQAAAFFTVGLLVAEHAKRLRVEESLSRTDALTGLRNRRVLVDEATMTLELCKRHARPVSVAYIDLDNFKQVNDSYGHARGDQVLKECASIIASSLRSTDLAARFGGDEFALLLPETSPKDAVALMERVRMNLANNAGLQSMGVTATIGVIGEEVSRTAIEDLLSRADARMYEAKSSGKNRVFGQDVPRT
jgi:diguanylate cyclase (GGDEF)-like protein